MPRAQDFDRSRTREGSTSPCVVSLAISDIHAAVAWPSRFTRIPLAILQKITAALMASPSNISVHRRKQKLVLGKDIIDVAERERLNEARDTGDGPRPGRCPARGDTKVYYVKGPCEHLEIYLTS